LKITGVTCKLLHFASKELKLILLLTSFFDKFELKRKVAVAIKMEKKKEEIKNYTACGTLCCFQVTINNNSAIPSVGCISQTM